MNTTFRLRNTVPSYQRKDRILRLGNMRSLFIVVGAYFVLLIVCVPAYRVTRVATSGGVSKMKRVESKTPPIWKTREYAAQLKFLFSAFAPFCSIGDWWYFPQDYRWATFRWRMPRPIFDWPVKSVERLAYSSSAISTKKWVAAYILNDVLALVNDELEYVGLR